MVRNLILLWCCFSVLIAQEPVVSPKNRLPDLVKGHLQPQVYLDGIDELTFTHFISREQLAVNMVLEGEDVIHRKVTKITFSRASSDYEFDPTVLPDTPGSATMLFKTDRGVAFVITVGSGEKSYYILYEIVYATMVVEQSVWSFAEFEQRGITRVVPLKLIQDEDQDESPATKLNPK